MKYNLKEKLYEEMLSMAEFNILDNPVNYNNYLNNSIDWEKIIDLALWDFNPNVIICNVFNLEPRLWWENQGFNYDNLQEELIECYEEVIRINIKNFINNFECQKENEKEI